jgi:NitT/TauT family transport system substrate-binding protein
MKKIIFGIVLLFIIVGTIIFIIAKNSKPDVKDNKVKVAEVAHSIFYAPQYIADKKGFFKEEGLEVEFILTPGADKVTSAVLSKDVDIGFCGSEASIYV